MNSEERISVLESIKLDISGNFARICRHHEVDQEIIYRSEENINNIFDWMIEFYKQDLKQDKTSKKALMIGMANTICSLNIPMVKMWMHESPIEFLLYTSLSNSMPSHILEKAFLMPQVVVCDNKYALDIALIERRDPEIDGTEGVPIIGIECDGYEFHYSDTAQAAKTQERIRDIEMNTRIKIFSYTGKEIYRNCTKLAEQFWDYVEREVYPKI